MSFNNYKIVGEDAFLEILNNKKNVVGETIVDKEDIPKLIEFGISWSRALASATGKYYVYGTKYLGTTNGKPKYERIQLHRFLLNQHNPKIIIDHIDIDYFNNRKNNLRETDKSGNCRNRTSKNSNNTSGYRNVTMMDGYWRIQLQINGKNKLFSEKFLNVDEAGEFAEKMRQKHYGKYAGKN